MRSDPIGSGITLRTYRVRADGSREDFSPVRAIRGVAPSAGRQRWNPCECVRCAPVTCVTLPG